MLPCLLCQASANALSQLFRLWLGITEYVYRSEELLAECIDTAIEDNTFRTDDLEFTFAARVNIHFSFKAMLNLLTVFQDWNERVQLGHMDGYREKFERIQAFFAPRFQEANKVGNEMIKTIEENLYNRKQSQQPA